MAEIRVCAIAAFDEERGIGKNNALPWSCPADMKHMRDLTRGHTLLMGSLTYLSLPKERRPLPERKSVVLTRSKESFLARLDEEEKARVLEKVELIQDAQEYIRLLKQGEQKIDTEILWVFGGEKVYRLTKGLWDEVFLTRIPGKHDCDAFFPDFEQGFRLNKTEAGEGCEFQHFVRILK